MDGAPDVSVDRKKYASKHEHLVIGLMSGTSLDGVDAALVRIETKPDGAIREVTLLHHSYLPYSVDLRRLLSDLCRVESARIDDLVYAHFGLSEWYAKAVEMVLAESGVNRARIDAVCMHGQTVWHAPEPRPFPGPVGPMPVKGTLQIGSSDVVRERTGIPVVADLRARDMAAGGEGAPLAPYLDALLFGSPEKGRIVQNIGGIGNATVIPAAAAASQIVAFDTGPGNIVIDGVVRLGTDGKMGYDADGAIAARGKPSAQMVELSMRDPYFARKPPKSTGREVYGAAFADRFMADARSRGLDFEDTVATATAFAAESMARAYRDFILPTTRVDEVLACGGGALNPTLLRMLRERLPAAIVVTTTSARGVPDQAREAMAFAVLGHESLMGRPGNLPAVTGARAPVVLGHLTL